MVFESDKCRCLSDIKRDMAFHTLGAVEENAREPMVVLVLGFIRSAWLDERR